MAKKLRSEDIIEKGLFKEEIESTEKWLKLVKGLKKEAKGLGDALKSNLSGQGTLKDADDVKKYTKAVDDLNNTTKELTKLEKEEVRLTEKLNDLKTEQAKTNVSLKQEIANQNKVLKRSVELDKAKEGSIKKLRLELSANKEAYIRLSKEERENIDIGVKLQQKIKEQTDALKEMEEAIGVTSRNVGNYKESVKEAIEEMGGFGSGLAESIDKSGVLGSVVSNLTTIQQMLVKALKIAKAQVKEDTAVKVKNAVVTKKMTLAQRGLSRATIVASKSFKVLKTAIVSTGIGALVIALTSLILAVTKTQAGMDGVAKAMNRISAVVEVIIGRIANLGLAINDLRQSWEALKSFDFDEAGKQMQQAIERGEKAFSGFEEEIQRAIKNADEYTKATIEVANAQIELIESIAKLSAEEEQYLAIADDTTRSFREREEASLKALQSGEERAKKELELAKQELELFEKQNKTKIEGQRLTREEQLQRVQLIKETIDAEKDLTLFLLDSEKQRRELKQDRLERDLDILIDGFDNQKTINERLINDERKTFDERVKILDETTKLANESFEAQKEVLSELSASGVDFNELLSLDATELQKKIRSLEQSEIIEGRTLEVIRERRLVLQDLEEIEKELLKLKTENEKSYTRQLEDAIANQIESEEAKAIRIEELSFERRKEEIQAEFEKFKTQEEINKLIEEEEKAHQKKINDIKEKARKDNEKAREDYEKKQAEKQKKQEEELRNLVQQTTGIIKDQLNQRTQAQINAIDKEINASKRKEDQLIASANAGNRLAEESIALERERQAKLEADRKKALQRQQRIELILASINAYSNRSRSGDENALLNTISDITTLLTFASNVQAFEKGGLVEGGEQLVRINEKGQEFVLKHDVVQKVGVDKLNRLNQGDINALNDRSGDLVATEYMIKQAMKGVASEVANAVKQIPVQNWNMSEITGGLKESIQEGKKIVNKHYKKQKRLS